MQNSESNHMYVVKDIPGRGNGLVATKMIRKGTRILCEEPTITIPEIRPLDDPRLLRLIGQQVDGLSEYQRDILFSMHNMYPYNSTAERCLGIARTVSLPIEDTKGNDVDAVFLEASRINHACDNNAQKHWNPNIQQHTVHALRDIKKDEEITVYYLGGHENRAAKQAKLKSRLGFVCSCRLCSLPLAQSQESDRRLESIRRLDGLINKGGLMGFLSSPRQTLQYVDQIVQLYNEQGPDDAGLPRAYLDAAQICIANGDLARGRIFMERAVSGWEISQGDDSRKVIENKTIARDPSKHPLYSQNAIWRTALEDVPRGLDQQSFEDWLWRREKPKPAPTSGVLSTLRSPTAFPSFENLPEDKSIDLTLYDRNEGGVRVPRRHWCLLAEIVGAFTLARLQIELKDIDGTRFDLICSTSGRGQELNHALVKKGHTVAVLYAERHSFMYEPQPGIRHEDPGKLKIIPVSLNTLLSLSDQVQQFSTMQDGLRTCHGCGRRRGSMQRCARCSSFWYCDKLCQKRGWKSNAHKVSCELFQDQDVRGLLNLEWDKFDCPVKFPLGI